MADDPLDGTQRSPQSTELRATAADPHGLPQVDAHRYTLDRELGRGAQSVVCLALDSAVGREVAFKMAQHASGNGAFVREARITGQLEHPGIVPVYEIGQDARGQMYCTQKLVRGRSLRAALDACAGETDRLALLPHLIDVCNAVAYAHSRGVVHRDLKPENVMVGEFGETVVLDWGIAKVLGEVDAQPVPRPLEGLAPQQTMQGAVMGTPLYLSPEQAAGDVDAIDRRSDVWSLGVMLYELVAGKLPFEAASLQTLLEKVKVGKYQLLPEALPGVSPELAAIVAHALQVKRADRFADAAAMARELAAFRAGGRLSVYAYSSWELLKRFVARNKALSAVAAAAVVAIAVSGTIAWSSLRASEASRLESQRQLAAQLLSRAHQAEARLDWTSASRLYRSAQGTVPSDEAQWGLAFTQPLAVPPERRQTFSTSLLTASFDRSGAVAVCALDQQRVYDAKGTLRGDFSSARYCNPRLSPQGTWLATTGDRVTLLYATASGTAVALEGAPHGYSFTFSPDERTLAVGLWTGAVELFDTETGKKTGTLAALAEEPVFMVGFSPNGRRLASGARGGTIAVWDLATLERSHRYQSRVFPNVALFDGDRLFVGDQDRFVEVFDLSGSGHVQTLAEHGRTISGLEQSPDGAVIASASLDGTIVVWDAKSLRPLTRLVAGNDVAAIAFVAGGSAIEAVTLDGQRLHWDLARLPTVVAAGSPGSYFHTVAFSPDAGTLAWSQTGGGVGTMRLGDATVRARALVGTELAWGPGELAIGTYRGIDFVDPITLHPKASFDSNGPDTRSLVWAPDGKSVWLSTGPTIERVARDTAQRVLSIDAGFTAQYVAASSDGTRIAWLGQSDRAVIWDVAAGRPLATPGGLTRPARGLTFSADGALIAAGGANGTVHVLDGKTGAERCRAFGHTSAVFDVTFAPDGHHLASASLDRTVRVWATEGCRQVATAPPLHGEATRVDWSPDGTRIAIGDTYGVITVFRLERDRP